MTKILLLGATGRTGKFLLKKAIEDGFQINCLARNSLRIENRNGLTIFEGDPSNKIDLEQAMEGCEGIINVLNVSRQSDFPWAKLRTAENYLSEVIKILVPLAIEKNIRRVIICSAWGAAETKKDIPIWFKWLIDNSNIGVTYRDHERQERYLSESDLNWTIVRPVGLTNSRKIQSIRETFENKPKPSLTISRRSVAHYLLECLKNSHLIKKTVVISKD